MRSILACSVAIIAGACAKKDNAAADSAAAAAATPAPAPAPPAFSMADVAGKWQMHSVPATGTDTTSTNYVLTATADTTGWEIVFPNGLKVPMHVSTSGDSVMMKTGSFASQRRKGVTVWTESVSRMTGGKLMGMTTAHYTTKGADSVLVLRTEGTKMQ